MLTLPHPVNKLTPCTIVCSPTMYNPTPMYIGLANIKLVFQTGVCSQSLLSKYRLAVKIVLHKFVSQKISESFLSQLTYKKEGKYYCKNWSVEISIHLRVYRSLESYLAQWYWSFRYRSVFVENWAEIRLEHFVYNGFVTGFY